jgi:hypothetical protein
MSVHPSASLSESHRWVEAGGSATSYVVKMTLAGGIACVDPVGTEILLWVGSCLPSTLVVRLGLRNCVLGLAHACAELSSCRVFALLLQVRT